MTSDDDYLEKRLSDIEHVSAWQFMRTNDLADKLEECRDRLRALISKERITVSTFYKDHPGILADLDRIDAVLGTNADKKKPQD